MIEFRILICLRVCGKERFRLYIEHSADKDGAIRKAERRARSEGIVPVYGKSRII